MGFRNRLKGRVVATDANTARVEVCGISFAGVVREPVSTGNGAVVSIRPEDLVAGSEAGLPGRVTSIEYRGRAFFGTAVAQDGSELFFRSDRPVAKDETIRLSAPADRTLVFAGAAA
jgi:putative spermidine/putrescine transport system ATP-binding protein